MVDSSEWNKNKEYIELLSLMASLSNLYSDNEIPFLHYRITENLFSKCFNADNLSRSDTAYDAKIENFGIGIKTFQLKNKASVEKIAEFNSISSSLKKYQNNDLAYQLAVARNDRINLGKRLYAIQESCYHIIGRLPNCLSVFNVSYPLIDVKDITSVIDTGSTLKFSSGGEQYSFNHSKSTLYKTFKEPEDAQRIEVNILEDPFELLRKLINKTNYDGKYAEVADIHLLARNKIRKRNQLIFGDNYVILPLFSTVRNAHEIPESSGLNQWNAKGRKRKADEVYIPIPAKINTEFPNFFPDSDVQFILHLPNGGSITAKICQQNRKALMSNPNTALGKWILRDVLQMKEEELVTYDLLNRMGFDSVIVYKEANNAYRIDVYRTASYSDELFS